MRRKQDRRIARQLRKAKENNWLARFMYQASETQINKNFWKNEIIKTELEISNIIKSARPIGVRRRR